MLISISALNDRSSSSGSGVSGISFRFLSFGGGGSVLSSGSGAYSEISNNFDTTSILTPGISPLRTLQSVTSGNAKRNGNGPFGSAKRTTIVTRGNEDANSLLISPATRPVLNQRWCMIAAPISA